MKKRLMANWFLKLLSILFAFILWLVVVNLNDPDRTVRITGIPIEILNEDVITGQGVGQIYQIESPANGYGSITVRGPRSLVDSLDRTKNGISATVNFGEVSSVGAVPITYTIPDGVTLVSRNVTTMRIKVEALEEQMFNIEVMTNGTPADNYVTGTVNISPTRLKVTAPTSLMEKIKKVVLELNVEGISTDITVQEEVSKLKFLDANGKAIEYHAEKNHVKFSIQKVNATLTMLKVKEVPVKVSVTGNVPEGYQYIGMEIGDNKVRIKGTPNKIAEIDAIVVPESDGLLDLSEMTADTEVTIDVSAYLPYGIALEEEDDRYLTVKLRVQQLYEKEIGISVSDLKIKNQPSGLELTYNVAGEIRAVFKGLKSDLEGLTIEQLSPYIDLAGIRDGTHSVAIYLSLPETITVEVAPVVSITLSYPTPETTTPLETESLSEGSESPPVSESNNESTPKETSSESTTIPTVMRPASNQPETTTLLESSEEEPTSESGNTGI